MAVTATAQNLHKACYGCLAENTETIFGVRGSGDFLIACLARVGVIRDRDLGIRVAAGLVDEAESEKIMIRLCEKCAAERGFIVAPEGAEYLMLYDEQNYCMNKQPIYN